MNKSANVIKMIDALNVFSLMFGIFLIIKFAAYSEKLKYWRMNEMGGIANQFILNNIFLLIFVGIVIAVLYTVRDSITGTVSQDNSDFDRTLDH